jgi:hypothetical protein
MENESPEMERFMLKKRENVDKTVKVLGKVR